MSGFVLKSKENRLQKPPTMITNKSSVPRRSIVIGTSTTTGTVTTHTSAIPQIRRSVPTNQTTNKTPDLLRPPKFGGQQLANYNVKSNKPDVTNHLPTKVIQKPTQHVPEKSKLDF